MHEKMLSITDHTGNTTQNHNEMSRHNCQMAIKKGEREQVLVRMWGEGNCAQLVELQMQILGRII